MTEIRVGDVIVIPKMSDWSFFCIATATGSYAFDDPPEGGKGDDFRHIIPVDSSRLRVIPHQSGMYAEIVRARLRAFRRRVNRIDIQDMKDLITNLQASYAEFTTPNIGKVVSDIMEIFNSDAVERVATSLSKLPPDGVEKIVCQLLEGAGYRIIERNHYDRIGGDADIVVEAPLPQIAEALNHKSLVVLQVKAKRGIDENDIEGIDQLRQISNLYPGASLVLISTADDFTELCKSGAETHGIQLIAKRTFARLFLKYAA